MPIHGSQRGNGQELATLLAGASWNESCATFEHTLEVFRGVTHDVARAYGAERLTAWFEQQTHQAEARLLRLRALRGTARQRPARADAAAPCPFPRSAEPTTGEVVATKPRPHADGVPLTAREREVAALIARGLSNRQIAEALVVVQGTAANHVANILRKLACVNRAQVAAWAVQAGLLTDHPG